MSKLYIDMLDKEPLATEFAYGHGRLTVIVRNDNESSGVSLGGAYSPIGTGGAVIETDSLPDGEHELFLHGKTGRRAVMTLLKSGGIIRPIADAKSLLLSNRLLIGLKAENAALKEKMKKLEAAVFSTLTF